MSATHTLRFSDMCLRPVTPWVCGEPEGSWRNLGEAGETCSQKHGPWKRDEDKWAFKSPAWEAADFVYVNLQEIHRQSDRPFIETLQKCRLGIPCSEQDLNMLLNHEFQFLWQLTFRNMSSSRTSRQRHLSRSQTKDCDLRWRTVMCR